MIYEGRVQFVSVGSVRCCRRNFGPSSTPTSRPWLGAGYLAGCILVAGCVLSGSDELDVGVVAGVLLVDSGGLVVYDLARVLPR